jgi:hypothetical protein
LCYQFELFQEEFGLLPQFNTPKSANIPTKTLVQLIVDISPLHQLFTLNWRIVNFLQSSQHSFNWNGHQFNIFLTHHLWRRNLRHETDWRRKSHF